MLKNKKLVLSSIAIILTLVVSSIFVNFTLAKSDSEAVLSSNESSASRLTGDTNIDLAIQNSNSSSAKASGKDKYRIVQIVPDSYSAMADADNSMTNKVTASTYSGVISNEEEYKSTSWLWRYVYNGEYFRIAVFNGYKTISENMAEGAVTLTTCKVSTLNSMDTNAQEILAEADFIYIWSNSYDQYISSDMSDSLFSWLDSYTTVDEHPLAICPAALCVASASDIKGNNDKYRMSSFAYKIMTKEGVSRYNNVLVTDSDFFETVYTEANNNKKEEQANTSTSNTLSDFILEAETKGTEKWGGGHSSKNYIGTKTYYKWSDGVSLYEFLGTSAGDYPYLSVGDDSKSGTTKSRFNESAKDADSQKAYSFDNAKILVISESEKSEIFNTLKKDSSAGNGNADNKLYAYNADEHTWKSIFTLNSGETGKYKFEGTGTNSVLTQNLYSNGKYVTSPGVPSGADIYLVTSDNLSDILNGTGKFSNLALSGTYYKNVKTAVVSGSVNLSDAYKEAIKTASGKTVIEDNELEGWRAYLLVVTTNDDGTTSVQPVTGANGETTAYTALTPVMVKDEETGEYTDEYTGEYTYSFDGLNPDYEYKVVLSNEEGFDDVSGQYYKDHSFGISSNIAADSYEYVYNFVVGESATDTTEGYTYKSGTDEMYVTAKDFSEYVEQSSGTGSDQLSATYSTEAKDVWLNDADKVVEYVKALRMTYEASQTALTSNNSKLSLTDYDFVFIDEGTYSRDLAYKQITDADGNSVEVVDSEASSAAFKALTNAVSNNLYFIVSAKAGDGHGSTGNGGDSGNGGVVVIDSPSAKAIADVINASSYREGSDNKFRVLEIQPDYPIDIDLAQGLPYSGSYAYSTRSDGTKITGTYYTVPSDVVSGKAKEELPSLKTEYYDFDLTKAKLAYAIDGLSYGDIELTQVSTEQLIGMTENISATYDLVYIGGDISALDRHPSGMYTNQLQIGSYSGYSYTFFPTFIMYYHTGMLNKIAGAGNYKMDRSETGSQLMATPYIGTTYYTTSYLVENGNDLTKTKLDELNSYISSGRPIIVSDELTTVYENMNGTNANGQKLSEIQKLQGYWYNNGTLERKNYYLDPSSRMYTLVEGLYTRSQSADTGSNVYWGFDVDDTKYISDKNGTYGISLWTLHGTDTSGGTGGTGTGGTGTGGTGTGGTGTGGTGTGVSNLEVMLDTDAQKQVWYNKDGQNFNIVYQKYHTVMSDTVNAKLNSLVSGSSQRVRLTVLNKPSTYKEGITSSYVKTNRLQFEFKISGDQASYDYMLYVDKDKNATFDTTEKAAWGKLQTGREVTETVSVTLDSDFFGSAAWYMEVKDSSGRVVATETGLSKIVNNQSSKAEINVLQIQTMISGQAASTWNLNDTLYFDITSQTAHKICKYNIYSNNADLDTSSPLQYTALGRHENRFGIYKYDKDTENDDYYSNLADQLMDDYDINLDMVVASKDHADFTVSKTLENGSETISDSYDCMDTMVSEADTLSKGGTVYDEYTKQSYTQSQYDSLASTALTEYATAASKVSAPKKALDDYLKGAIEVLETTGSGTYTTSYGSRGTYPLNNPESFFYGFNKGLTDEGIIELLNYMMETEDYSLIFWPVYSNNSLLFENGEIGLVYGKNFRDLFIAYRDAKDAELEAKDKYNTYLRRSYGKNFLTNMYSIIVLGPSDSFGGFKVDLSELSCQYILDYVSAGGDLFFFHDTMTPFADKGAVNLTKSLLTVVGMNRFHVDITNQANSYTVSSKDYAADMKATSLQAGAPLTSDGYVYIPASWLNDGIVSWDEVNGGVWAYGAGDGQYEYRDASGSISRAVFYRTWVKASEYETFSKNFYSKYATKGLGTTYLLYTEQNDINYSVRGTTQDLAFKSSNTELYYLTPYAFNTTYGSGLINSINGNMTDYSSFTGAGVSKMSSDTQMYVSALAMSALYQSSNDGAATTALPYVYAQQQFQIAGRWSGAANGDESVLSETVKATQLNEGLVTLYPYNITSTLNISGTHQQAYALDLESDNVTVWYTLAGSNNTEDARARSSKYAASPGDAMESYFIYTTSYGTGAITYCGAGHSSLTGKYTNNEDERKLFINVIVNSAAAVPEKPTITCYKPTQKYVESDELDKDQEAMAESGNKIYLNEVESKTDTPDFDLKVTMTSKTKVNRVRIYYDLDYDDTDYSVRPGYDEKSDVLITEFTTQGTKKLTEIEKEIKQAIRDGEDSKLALQDSYFANYGGNYTYIVVEAYYQGKAEPVYVMIKIKASDPLFDLTENTIDTPAGCDYIAEKKYTLA